MAEQGSQSSNCSQSKNEDGKGQGSNGNKQKQPEGEEPGKPDQGKDKIQEPKETEKPPLKLRARRWVRAHRDGVVFVPLTTVCVGTFTNEQMGNATGMFNLTRNIGGSIGISLINTLIAWHQQIHRNELVKNLTPLNMSSCFLA
jgi:hypothetical protein